MKLRKQLLAATLTAMLALFGAACQGGGGTGGEPGTEATDGGDTETDTSS